MATTSTDIYEVTCEGEYYAHNGTQKGSGHYVIKAKMDEKAKALGFLSVFRNKILSNKEAMLTLYPDWKRFRTHVITETRNLTNANKPVKEMALMNRKQVIDTINRLGIGVDPELYPSVQELRQAVRDWKENREAFEKVQNKRRLTMGDDIAVSRSVASLNPWLQTSQTKGENTTGTTPEPATAPGFETSEYDNEFEIDALITGV